MLFLNGVDDLPSEHVKAESTTPVRVLPLRAEVYIPSTLTAVVCHHLTYGVVCMMRIASSVNM